MKEIINAAVGDGIIEHNTLFVWPKNGNAGGDLLITPKTGLRDYPSFTQYGVQVRYEFHREIAYRSVFTLVSDLVPKSRWTVIRIDYNLQSNTPHGDWFAIIDGVSLDAPVLPIP
ncbi:hypothetical protein [Bradyrhizobium sp. USDA 4506]